MIALYNVLSTLAVLLYSPWILTRQGPSSRSDFIRERFGAASYSEADIWVHAVSVGEVLASLPFLKALRRDYPGSKILLSTTTYTGQDVARRHFPEADRIMYMPVDSPLCTRRAVRAIRPRLFVAIETELWPSLFYELKGGGSKIMVVNGRLSLSSYKGYRVISFFMKDVLSMIDLMLMQGRGDAERIIAIGAPPERVEVMGNLKFDIEPSDTRPPDWMDAIPGKVLLAASTHNGEDEIIIDAYDMLKKEYDDLRLIIAPRHPERFDQVFRLMSQTGYRYSRRSSIETGSDIVLLDTVGEMFGVFSRADVAFVGGSLVQEGGHNILEPAYWGKPILFGPHMENFPVAQDFLAADAAAEVNDAHQIYAKVKEILSNAELAEKMGNRAREIVQKNRGAVKKASEAVRRLLGTL